MAGPINLKQQKSSFTATVIFFILNYDLFRLQAFFSENVCESLMRKAQHIVFDARNIVMNL